MNSEGIVTVSLLLLVIAFSLTGMIIAKWKVKRALT
jgi:hypothetical protein